MHCKGLQIKFASRRLMKLILVGTTTRHILPRKGLHLTWSPGCRVNGGRQTNHSGRSRDIDARCMFYPRLQPFHRVAPVSDHAISNQTTTNSDTKGVAKTVEECS